MSPHTAREVHPPHALPAHVEGESSTLMFELSEYVRSPLIGVSATALICFGIALCYVIGVTAVVTINAVVGRLGHPLNPVVYTGACDLAGLFGALTGCIFTALAAFKWFQVF